MKQKLLFALFFLSSVHAYSSSCKHTSSKIRCIEYVDNYDGDTVTINIPGIHPIFGHHMKIRIAGIDTPEIRGKTECEKKKAIQAKKVVERILQKAKRIELHNISRGKYFRIVGDLIADRINIKDILLKKKLAVPYDGGTKQQVNWCH